MNTPKNNDRKNRNYLFLLQHSSIEARKIAVNNVRESGVVVTAQHGTAAIEVLCDAAKAEALFDSGLFLSYSAKKISPEAQKKLTGEHKAVIDLWNIRFSKGYQKMKKDKVNYGKSWGSKELKEPAPYTKFDTERLKELLRSAEEKGKQTGSDKTQFNEKDIPKIEERFRRFTSNETDLQHLVKMLYYLDKRQKKLLFTIDWELLKEILEILFREAACWKMTGEMSVGIVFVESSLAGGPKFGNNERNEICAEIIDGFNYLSSQHPSGNLSWVYDLQFISINTPNGPDNDDTSNVAGGEAHWRDPAMQLVNYNGNTYTGDWSGVVNYREDMRRRNFSRHSIAVFVTPYGNNWHAYAGGSRLTLAKHHNWGGSKFFLFHSVQCRQPTMHNRFGCFFQSHLCQAYQC
jgi:hypothetical protein